MNDHELEQRLRSWYRAEISDGDMAPVSLRADLTAVVRAPVTRSRWLAGPRGLPLLAAAVLAALAIAGAIAVGGALLRSATVSPVPAPQPSPQASLRVIAAPTSQPTTSSTRGPASPETSPGSTIASSSPAPSSSASAGPLGGGLLLVRGAPHDANGAPIDTIHGMVNGTYDVFTLDLGTDRLTGYRTLLGTVPYTWSTAYQPEFQWSVDRKHVLIQDRHGKVWPLGSPTADAQDLTIACCQQPGVVGWVLSPRGDRMAGIRVPEGNGADPPSAIVVSNVDGSGVRTLPLPLGTDSGASGDVLSWSPDESAVVIAGCRPCNYADPGKTPTHVMHSRLFVVPLDGSPVRELLDDTRASVWDPSWSADGRSIVVGRNDCPPKEIPPYCGNGHLSVASVNVADGDSTTLADAPHLASGPWVSPDGTRIAFGVQEQGTPVDYTGGIVVMDADGRHLVRIGDGFDPHWSPDSRWLLYTAADGFRIVPADGGASRPVGPFSAAAW